MATAVPGSTRTPSDAVQFADHVRHLLADLRQPDQSAIRLVYFAGLSQDQAAARLNLTRQGIRSCVARGMREVAARLITDR